MSRSVAATIPHELAAKKLGEWLSKIVHRVGIEKIGNQWAIMVPDAALSRARRALSEVMVAANPPKCCATLGKGAPCARCKKHSHFTVDWIIPGRVADQRPACSSACAVALKRGAKANSGAGMVLHVMGRRIPVRNWSEASNAVSVIRDRSGLGASEFGPARIYQGGKVIAHVSYNGRVWAGAAYKAGATPLYQPNPVNKRARRAAKRTENLVKEQLGLRGPALRKRAQWTGGMDAFGQGQRAGSGFVRFWLWNDREWPGNMTMIYHGSEGPREFRNVSSSYADEQASEKNIAAKFPGQVGKWKAGFILAFEKAIAAYAGPDTKEWSEELGDYKDPKTIDARWRRRLGEKRARLAQVAAARTKRGLAPNPSAEAAWAKMTSRQRYHTLRAAGIDEAAAELRMDLPWSGLPTVYHSRLRAVWMDTTARRSRGTTKRLSPATANPSREVRLAREAKVKMLLVRITSILQAGHHKMDKLDVNGAAESYQRAEALWSQMPKGVAMVSPRTRREAYDLSRVMVRLQNRIVMYEPPRPPRAKKNAGERYLIQALRPKHRNWVTIDLKADLNRALLNALQRARLGDVEYRVWDTEDVKEVWRGKGREATIEGWTTSRPAGLVGANRRKAMNNPRISKRMQPLRENTMRLGDAMKYGRILLDTGIPILLWDGSGWEVHIKPDDSYSTSSGKAATGGRRYLSQGAGLIKTWPITLLSEAIKPGAFIGVPAIRHFLAHRKSGVASNGRACPNPLCKANPSKSKRREPYCRMCGKDKPHEGPFKPATDAGWMSGQLACLECRQGIAGLKRAKYRFPGKRSVSRNQGPAGENPRIAHEEIVGAFLAGRAKKVGPRYWTDGNLLRVWGNLVAKKTSYGVDIMDAGWRTLLTRNVLNTVLRHMGAGTIYQKKRQWYISTPQGDVAWPGEWPVHRAGAAANPRIRAWDIVASIPGKRGEWTMQSGIKDKKRALETAKIYQRIALKERRKHKYVVRPFRYSDWQTRMKKNPLTQKEVDQLRRNETFYRMGQRIEVRAGNTKDAMQLQGAMQESRVIREKHRGKGVTFRPGPQGLTLRQIDALPNGRARRNPVEGWVVTRDGETLKTGFKNHLDAMGWLHRQTSTSVDHAVKHEGYDIVEVRAGKVVQSYKRDVIGNRKRYRANPLTSRESARLIRKARQFMGSAKDEFSSRGRHYRFGQASGVAAAVQLAGPRRAEVPAAMIRGRAMKAHRVVPNPRRRKHLGLKGLMSNSAAKNAMRFA